MEGLCRNYVNQQTGRIKRAFKWSVSRELVPVEIHAALATASWLRKGKTVAKDDPPVTAVSDDVVEATLKHVVYGVTCDMIRFQRLVGCRPSELFIVRLMDIDQSEAVREWIWVSSKRGLLFRVL